MADPIERATSFKLLTDGPLDWWYGPYNSLNEACNAVDVRIRAGRTVGIISGLTIVEYIWHPKDVSNSGLVAKSPDSGSSYKGPASPNSDPGLPSKPEYWTATEPGVYPNFGNVTVTGFSTLSWNGLSWTVSLIGAERTASLANNIVNYKIVGNTIYDLICPYTGDYFTANRATTLPGGTNITDDDVDNIIYFKVANQYYKRNFTVYNVEYFGAIGNENVGSEFPIDSSDAFQKVFDFVPNHSTVYIPSNRGEFFWSKTVTCEKFNIKLITDDQGPYVPVIRGDGDYWLLHVKHVGFQASRIGFKGNGDQWTGGIYNPSAKGILLDRNDGTNQPQFADIDANIKSCLFFYLGRSITANGRNLTVADCDFSNNVNGVKIDRVPGTECRGHKIVNNRFHTNGHGERELAPGVESWCVEITSPVAFNNVVSNNFVESKSRGFFKGPVDRTKITGNHGTLMYGDMVRIIDPQGAFWHGWEITHNTACAVQDQPTAAMFSHMDYGIVAEGLLANGSLGNNTITFSRKHGIYLPNAVDLVLDNNKVLSPNKAAATDGSIYDGIHIGGGSSNMLTDNKVRSTRPGGAGHRYGIYNNSTGSVFNSNFGYNHTVAFFKDDQEASNRVQNDIEPNYVQSFYNGPTVDLETGFDSYNVNTNLKKYIAGSLRLRKKDGTAGGEDADWYIRAVHNGVMNVLAKFFHDGGMTVGNRDGLELLQNGVVNARVLYADMMRFLTMDPATTASLTFFTDTNDKILKFKDYDSQTRQVAFEDKMTSALDANYSITFDNFVKLPVITANRTVSLAAVSARVKRLKVWNTNTSGFTWAFSGLVKNPAGVSVTTIINGKIYSLFRDGTDWIIDNISE